MLEVSMIEQNNKNKNKLKRNKNKQMLMPGHVHNADIKRLVNSAQNVVLRNQNQKDGPVQNVEPTLLANSVQNVVHQNQSQTLKKFVQNAVRNSSAFTRRTAGASKSS